MIRLRHFSPSGLRATLFGCVVFLSALALTGRAAAQTRDPGEIVILSGGPALRTWENFRIEDDRHDRWWGNFVRPARVRMQALRIQYGEGARITWLVHRRSYLRRAGEEQRPLASFVESVRDTVKCKLVWYESGDDVINYLNRGENRRSLKITHFEYYGHSNKYCLMFDYSNDILGVSTSNLHVNDLRRIKNRAFHRDAFVKSWGCHTGEAMSEVWRREVGVPMIGAVGKTDYSAGYHVVLSPGGRWRR